MNAAPLDTLWRSAGLPDAMRPPIEPTGDEPVLPSSFPVALAAQSAIAAAAGAASALARRRDRAASAATVSVDRRDAALETTGWFSIDGRVPPLWDPLSGLYRCGDGGWLRVHANFAHHRDGALRLAGLPPGSDRAALERALATRGAFEFEQAAADAGLVVAALRTFDDWDAHPQGRALADAPPLTIERIGDGGAPWAMDAAPRIARDPTRPLHGLRVLDLTRILAGPVAGRTLAAYGADVMLVNGPHLPNIDSIADTSRGKRSALVDLRTDAGRDTLRALLRDAHVFQQGYRPGGLDALGFGADALAALRPGIVCVSLSAYGHVGPWAGRRGFDSLVQTATGFNHAEAQAAGQPQPRPLPVQVLDYCAGFLMAFGAAAALLRQADEGGSWQVRVSLAAVGRWLRTLPAPVDGLAATPPARDDGLQASDSGFGRLLALRHAARFDGAWTGFQRPSMPPGSHAPRWDAAT